MLDSKNNTVYGTLVIAVCIKTPILRTLSAPLNNRPPRRVVIHRVKFIREDEARMAFEDFKILNSTLVKAAERDADLTAHFQPYPIDLNE